MPEKTSPTKPVRAPRRASATTEAASAVPKSSEGGDRIAKVLSRAGVASRREAERLIEAGEVKVNGKVVTSPALNVTAADKITVSGQPVAAPEPARMWLYYKPNGLVTSSSDEKGRDTIFDYLPEDLPRVMTIGRLDLNSEGLLLLTNDGELKRRLELPSTGWLRKYRVRVNGNPLDPDFEPLRKGITIEGERFAPMEVIVDRHQGSNAWLTVGLREGRNREIRRAMGEIGLAVNRLIRISYGPFRLNELEPGEVEEIRPRVLRDQLGTLLEEDPTASARPRRPTVTRDDGTLARATRSVLRTRKAATKDGMIAEVEPGHISSNRGRAALDELSSSWQKATKPEGRNYGADRGERSERSEPRSYAKPEGRSYGSDRGERSEGRSFGKPEGKSFGGPRGERSEGRSFGKPEGKSFGGPRGERSEGRSFGKPEGKSFGGPRGERSEGRSFGKPEGKSFGGPRGERSEGRSFGKPEGKSFGGPRDERSEGRSFGKPEGKSFGKPDAKGPRRPSAPRQASTRNAPQGGKPAPKGRK